MFFNQWCRFLIRRLDKHFIGFELNEVQVLELLGFKILPNMPEEAELCKADWFDYIAKQLKIKYPDLSWMSWGNREGCFQLDHIKALTSEGGDWGYVRCLADGGRWVEAFAAIKEDNHLKEVMHFTNLQPLSIADHLQKSLTERGHRCRHRTVPKCHAPPLRTGPLPSHAPRTRTWTSGGKMRFEQSGSDAADDDEEDVDDDDLNVAVEDMEEWNVDQQSESEELEPNSLFPLLDQPLHEKCWEKAVETKKAEMRHREEKQEAQSAEEAETRARREGKARGKQQLAARQITLRDIRVVEQLHRQLDWQLLVWDAMKAVKSKASFTGVLQQMERLWRQQWVKWGEEHKIVHAELLPSNNEHHRFAFAHVCDKRAVNLFAFNHTFDYVVRYVMRCRQAEENPITQGPFHRPGAAIVSSH